MTREQAISWLKEIQSVDDTEMAHVSADTVLCELLGALGYADVVSEWHKIEKWYA